MFTFITHYPLGNYVMGTWVLMACILGASAYTVSNIKDVPGQKCGDAMAFFGANCAIALVHCVMAFYLQYKIKAFINKEEHEKNPGAAADEDLCFDKDIPHAQISAAARHIGLYDIGFCLYFFAFYGALGYNMYGMGSLEDCEGENVWQGWFAASGMIGYGFFCSWYFFCWYCMQACCGAKENRQAKQKGGSAAPPQQVGVSE